MVVLIQVGEQLQISVPPKEPLPGGHARGFNDVPIRPPMFDVTDVSEVQQPYLCALQGHRMCWRSD